MSHDSGNESGGGRVLCPHCGLPQPGDADSCAACDTNFRRLCACGSVTRFDDTCCPGCGVALTPSAFDRAKARRVRWAKGLAATALAAGAVWAGLLVLRPAPPEPWKLMEEAVRLRDAGDCASALRMARQLVEVAPRNARGWLLRGLCETDLRFDPTVTAESFAAAWRLDPASPDAGRAYARALVDAGRTGEALAVLAAALASRPTDSALLRTHAEACIRSRPPLLREAERSLGVARANGADGIELRLLRAFVGLSLHGDPPAAERPPELAAALADAESALATTPMADWASTHASAAARVFLALGRHDEASTVAARAAASAPDSAQAAELRAIVGTAAIRRGDLEAATREFSAALAASPGAAVLGTVIEEAERAGLRELAGRWLATAPRDPGGDIRAARGILLMADGRFDDAAPLLEASCAADPANGKRWLTLGDARAGQGRPDAARAAWTEASSRGQRIQALSRTALLDLRTATDEQARAAAADAAAGAAESIRAEVESGAAGPEGWACLARMSFAAGRAEDADAQAARALREAPGRVDLILLVAATSAAVGTPESLSRSSRALDSAHALRPQLAGFADVQARARFASGDLATAITFASAALEREPERADMLVLRGRAFAAAGTWPGAVADFSRAWELSRGRDPRVLVALVDALCRSGQTSAARAAFDAARDGLDREVRSEILGRLGPESGGGDSPEDVATAAEARARMERGDAAGAVAVARAVLVRTPGDPAATLVAVMALLEGADFDVTRVKDARALLAALAPAASRAVADLLEGRVLLAEDAPREAAEALARAASAMPDDPVVSFLRGEALVRSGREEEGLGHLRLAARLAGVSAGIRRQIGVRMVRVAMGHRGDSREELVRESAGIAPDDPTVADALIGVLLDRADYDSALSRAEGLLADRSLPARAAARLRWRALAAAFAAGRPERVAVHLAELPAAERDTGRAWVARGALDAAAGDLVAAQRSFEQAVRAMPDDPVPVIGLASAMLRSGRAADAAVRVDAWSASHPGQSGPALAYARMLADAGRIDEAIERCRRRAESEVHDPACDRQLAGLLLRRGRRTEAVSVLRRSAARAAPADSLRARLELGQALVVCGGDPAEALAIARTAAGVEARVLEAEATAAMADHAGAARLAEAVLSGAETGEPGLVARAHFVLGAVALAERRTSVAAQHFEVCVAKDPSHANAANNLAWILAGDPSTSRRALELARRATDLAPFDPNVWDTRGMCASAASRTADAESSWKKALELAAQEPAAEAAARGRTAMRLVRLLDLCGRSEEAKTLARETASFAKGTDAGAEAARFAERR